MDVVGSKSDVSSWTATNVIVARGAGAEHNHDGPSRMLRLRICALKRLLPDGKATAAPDGSTSKLPVFSRSYEGCRILNPDG